MKTILTRSITFATMLLLILSLAAETYANKGVDEIPQPVGGISAIMKNVKYPDEAKKEGIQGKVFIQATVDASGEIVDIKVIKSASPLLDEAALSAIKNTKFKPATKNGKPVKAEVTIPVMFKLDNCENKKE